ncbi:MAG: TetM/TetW/TetO/TetS family tetracycline resistance ribosomal protection protein [Clostridia bacterium]|nr:TetM/TetW/TetO/TetS family tetracycline resistance ribosomal protection protein [Clostridia bacterium]
MKKLVLGVLAHVDSGKTTLSEAMLYLSGTINKLGRVDKEDSFFDNFEMERKRGITIFSKQAKLTWGTSDITLLDTPGHIDFSLEAERALKVLDYAVLIISATDGIQSHTETIWKMLSHYNIPTFIFVNKTDILKTDLSEIKSEISQKLEGSVDFSQKDEAFYENLAMASEALLEEYSASGKVSDKNIISAIKKRSLFPVFYGSALKGEGVEELLDAVDRYTEVVNLQKFGATVYKISEDDKGKRLTHLKITGGTLQVKSLLDGEKVNEIRIYQGGKYLPKQEAVQGEICAVTGLSKTFLGEGFGEEETNTGLLGVPVFSHSVKVLDGTDLHNVLIALRKIEEEENGFNVILDERNNTINIELMGEVQMEVLKAMMKERFDIEIGFSDGNIIYKETVKTAVEGVGHFEPLRHYAEVHLLIEPLKQGEGIKIGSRVSEDVLDRNWQRLIMTHLTEKTHLGTLIGAPLTDVRISIVSGAAHKKHTEGGDFRQATYRAVRQGLMMAEMVLLEPWNRFSVLVPTENIGRAMTDLELLGAKLLPPETDGEMTGIKGEAPLSALGDYQKEIIKYTHGKGKIHMSFSGYKPCKNQEEIVDRIGYNPENDLENTPDSVFCAHGSGFTVKWDEVYEHMHLPLEKAKAKSTDNIVRQRPSVSASDEELLRIFEMTYGKVTRKQTTQVKRTIGEREYKIKAPEIKEEYLLIDGYNIIFASPEMTKIAKESLEDARDYLVGKVVNFQAVKRNNVIVVFDAYKVKGNVGEVEQHHGISVVYTKEAETADAYIEKTAKKLVKNYRVKVATSDNQEQIIIFGSGAVRLTAKEFLEDIAAAEQEIRDFIKNNNV